MPNSNPIGHVVCWNLQQKTSESVYTLQHVRWVFNEMKSIVDLFFPLGFNINFMASWRKTIYLFTLRWFINCLEFTNYW
jgi:hypothetical protein